MRLQPPSAFPAPTVSYLLTILGVGRPARPESVEHALDRAPRLARARRISRDDRQEAIAPQRVQLEVGRRLNHGGTPHSAQQSDLPEALTFESGANQWRRWSQWPPARETKTVGLYFGADEVLLHSGEVPTAMAFLIAGRVRLTATVDDGSLISVGTLEEGAFLGQTALTRQPVLAGAYALDEVTVLQIDRAHMEELVLRKPLLLQEIGRAIDDRRANVLRVLAMAGD